MKLGPRARNVMMTIPLAIIVFCLPLLVMQKDVIELGTVIDFVSPKIQVTEKVRDITTNISKECEIRYENYMIALPSNFVSPSKEIFMKECEVGLISRTVYDKNYGLLDYDLNSTKINGLRSIDEILENRSVVCLDQTIVACSLAKSLNFTCFFMMTQNHAFPVIRYDYACPYNLSETCYDFTPMALEFNGTGIVKEI